MPATFSILVTTWSVLMVAVMIGVDPHKGSHTAVVRLGNHSREPPVHVA